jgi:hypothetical protein
LLNPPLLLILLILIVSCLLLILLLRILLLLLLLWGHVCTATATATATAGDVAKPVANVQRLIRNLGRAVARDRRDLAVDARQKGIERFLVARGVAGSGSG